MQRIKILVFIVLISFGFLFNGELYMLYLDNFEESYYQANFYPDGSTEESNQEIVQKFVAAGEEYDVDFFVVDNSIRTAYNTKITLHGTEDAIKYLRSHGIKKGESKSLFFGKTAVQYKEFQRIDDISKSDTFYFIGGEEKKKGFDAFKAKLIDEYGGGFPKKLQSDRETWLNLLSVWGIVFGLALAMTLYGILYQKKEIMVRIILGENLITIFLKNILIDSIGFTLLFLLVPCVLSNFSHVYFKMSFVLLLFLAFLIFNSLLNAMVLRIHFKKDINGGNGAGGILTASYLFKIVTAISVSLILAGNVPVIRDAYNLYQQRSFFESHKEYSYYQTEYKQDNHLGKTAEDDDRVVRTFYQRFQNNSLQYAEVTKNFGGTYPVVLNNRTAMVEVKESRPAIAEAVQQATDEKVYLLIPANISKNSQEYTVAKQIGEVFFDYTVYGQIETVQYEQGASLIGIHKENEYKTKQYKDPIILFDNTDSHTKSEYILYCAQDTMYNLSSQEWDSFIREFNLEDQIISKTNVLDVYEHNWSIASRNVKMILILSLLLIFIEMMLIVFIIQLEYQFNAVEMALKKVHGYSLFNRNKHILRITIFSSLVGILIALVVSNVLGMQGGIPLILVGLLLLLLELCYITGKARRIEKATISSILKGEKK